MTTYKLATNYFYGNKASDYAIENGFLDYATFAKSFDAVLNNGIISNTSDIGYWDKSDRIVQSHGWKYNIDRFVCDKENELEMIVSNECMCQACMEKRNA